MKTQSRQLSMFEAEPDCEETPSEPERELQFFCGMPGREGDRIYTHLIRDKHDPERPPRDGQTMRWRTIREHSVDEWRMRIVHLLSDGTPRTFNRIMLELAGFTADVCASSNADKGLWKAVRQHQLLLTLEAPVFFTSHPYPDQTEVCAKRVD
jgi:hypothetical protein